MDNQKQTAAFGAANLQINKELVNIAPTTLMTAEDRYRAEIFVNEEPISWLADAVEAAVDAASYGTAVTGFKNDELPAAIDNTVSSVVKAACIIAVGARVAQVSQQRTNFDKKNFEYIALFGPVLASYGVYHNAEEAYDIIPQMGDELESQLKSYGVTFDKGFTLPAWYTKAMLMARKFNLMTGFGLPKDITVDSPKMFKLTVDTDLRSVVGKPGATPEDVMIATLVSSSQMTDLFGAYRTLYCGINATKRAIEELGFKALHNLK